MNELREIVRREVQTCGAISFARFMELSLYCPAFGYYERLANTPGRRGDFYTSVSVGSLFGELLAFQFSSWVEKDGLEKFQLLEAGAHDGRLAADILLWFHTRRPDLISQLEYWILEPSCRRRQWQKKTLEPFAASVRWFDSWDALPPPGAQGVIFSNELLDAFPVHRLGWNAREQKWFEWAVGWEQERFVWQKRPLDSTLREPTHPQPLPGGELTGRARTPPPIPGGELIGGGRTSAPLLGGVGGGFLFPASPDFEALLGMSGDAAGIAPQLLSLLPDNFTTEVSPAARAWWRRAATALNHGRLLTFDYGLNAGEFFLPHRADGTVRAFHRHHSANDLLAHLGEQDLSAHVNFTALQSAGSSAGIRTEELCSQAQFLTRLAAQTWRPDSCFGQWTPKRTRQFQTLTHPEHLGRDFRVLVQCR